MGRRLRVLIVDDSAPTRDSLRRLLEFQQDIEVVGEAADGEEAINQARALVPDVILMDINMKPVDGITATEVISAEVPRSVIVMMSVQENRSLAAGNGCRGSGYLTKPFGADELVTLCTMPMSGSRGVGSRWFPAPICRSVKERSSQSSAPKAELARPPLLPIWQP